MKNIDAQKEAGKASPASKQAILLADDSGNKTFFTQNSHKDTFLGSYFTFTHTKLAQKSASFGFGEDAVPLKTLTRRGNIAEDVLRCNKSGIRRNKSGTC
jgi:hypothetical protein